MYVHYILHLHLNTAVHFNCFAMLLICKYFDVEAVFYTPSELFLLHVHVINYMLYEDVGKQQVKPNCKLCPLVFARTTCS